MDTITKVAIHREGTAPYAGYYAKCLSCDTRVCDHSNHNSEKIAVRHARVHRCEVTAAIRNREDALIRRVNSR